MLFKLKILFYYFLLKNRKKKITSTQKLKHWQKSQFSQLLAKINGSIYYSSKKHKTTDLEEFEILDKNKYMNNFNEINTVGITRENAFKVALEAEKTRDFSPEINGITIGLSSGTSGNKGIFLASEEERAKWVAAMLDRVIGMKAKKRKIAFFLRANSNLYESANASSILSFNFFDLMKPMEDHLLILQQLSPEILIAQPSALLQLADQQRNGVLKINPSKIISVAEVLEPQDKEILEVTFKQKIHQVYQCTEGFLAATCTHGTLHFNEDFLIVEKKYIDKERKRFHPIITDLMRTSQPIIRYELNDILIEKKNCECGSLFMGIESIEGRSDDILSFMNQNKKTIKIYPDFMRRAIIMSDDSISFYTLTQKSNTHLSCYFESKKNKANIQQKIIESINNLLHQYEIYDVKIDFEQQHFLPVGQKLRRIKNENK